MALIRGDTGGLGETIVGQRWRCRIGRAPAVAAVLIAGLHGRIRHPCVSRLYADMHVQRAGTHRIKSSALSVLVQFMSPIVDHPAGPFPAVRPLLCGRLCHRVLSFFRHPSMPWMRRRGQRVDLTATFCHDPMMDGGQSMHTLDGGALRTSAGVLARPANSSQRERRSHVAIFPCSSHLSMFLTFGPVQVSDEMIR